MTQNIELLAPAGNWDAMVAAVQNGADAVYLGGKGLNARAGAGNFDSDELKRAADYLHERGKKMHVTLNTVLKQNEINKLIDAAADLAAAGADAAIVQDFGVCNVLKKVLPSLKLHASTQMAVHNKAGASYLKQRGFARVVLAREMSLEDAAECAACGIETEIFCHGALCVACSGQCLFSSLVGGRSGNRGMCAQPCRLPYTLSGYGKTRESGYLLSTKDLMTVDRISDFAAAGASSIKIEGRLKRPEYVAVVVRAYRRALDGEKINEADIEELKQIFNRGGFTSGYLRGISDGIFLSKQRPSHWGVSVGIAKTSKDMLITRDVLKQDALVLRTNAGEDIPVSLEGIKGRTIKNPTGKPGELIRLVSAKQMQAAGETLKNEVKLPVSAMVSFKTGMPCACTVSDGANTVNVTGELVQKAEKAAPDAERICAQFKKTGGTPYQITDIDLELDKTAFAPVSTINSLRREALETLKVKRIQAAQGCESRLGDYEPALIESIPALIPKIVVQSADAELLRAALASGADETVLFPNDVRGQDINLDGLKGAYIYLPNVLSQASLDNLRQTVRACEQAIKGVYISNIGQLAYDWPGEIRLDFALNIANNEALSFLPRARYTPSPELTAREIGELGGEKELIVYGRLPLMHLRHCPLNAALNGGKHDICTRCDKMSPKPLNGCTLTDRKNVVFPLRRLAQCGGCVIDVLNSVPLSLDRHITGLPKASSWRLLFTDESVDAVKNIVKHFKALAEGKNSDYTIDNYTTGHYFRGVE